MQTILLSRTLEGERNPVGTLGRPVSSFYPQLKSYISEELSPEIANYFAEPVLHEDDGGVDWYTECSEQPTPLADLTKSERVAVLAVLTSWRQKLEGLAIRSKAEKPEMHQILTLVLSEPSLQDIFVCDEKPILVNWGYSPPEDFVAFSYSSKNEDEKPAHNEQKSTGRLNMSVLTLCMITALGLAALAGILRLTGVYGTTSGTPEAALAELDTNALSDQQLKNAHLRSEIDGLQETYVGLLLSCAQECSVPINPVVPTPIPDPAPEPEPEEELEPLVIPEDATDTAFLEGTWRSFQNQLYTGSESNKNFLEIEYEINADGTGVRTLEVEDGRICTGKVTALLDANGSLIIRDTEAAMCTEHGGITDYTVTCDTSQGSNAVCTMSSNDTTDTEPPISVELRRLK